MNTNIDAERGTIDFQYAKEEQPCIIKVIGVGGAGGNNVNKMYSEGLIRGVSYLLCNTDDQHLRGCEVPHKICLGPNVTKGLGAGDQPDIARQAAEDSADQIREALNDGTEMVFVAAGLGKGTGTGAAPVVGKIAKEAGKLTIGIVMIPFLFEGKPKVLQALDGLKKMKDHVDAMIVVNNERLKEVYGKLSMDDSLKLADETLINATRSISNVINLRGKINVDFNDVKTTLQSGRVAVISSYVAKGENRMRDAIRGAIESPLINNNQIKDSQRLLIYVYQNPESPMRTEESEYINEFTTSINAEAKTIWGYGDADDLEGDQIRVTILASGFDYQTTEDNIRSLRSDLLEKAEAAEKQAQDEKLIQTYYGDAMHTARVAQPLILTPDELDDDEILSIAEEVPAFKRDLRSVQSVRHRRRNAALQQAQAQARAEANAAVGALSDAPAPAMSTPEADTRPAEGTSSSTIFFD